METISKNLPRDVFLYFLAIVALAMSAVNFGVLLFQFVNIYLPDPLAQGYYSASAYYGGVRWAVATLVIVFPVLVWVSRFLQKDIDMFPEKRELRIRKWLLYLTLFVAGMVVIGDLIALIYSFLEGELTLRFILKVGIIFFIAGSVFYYYLNELRERSARWAPVLAKAIGALVAIGIISGFFVAGSPQKQRIIRFDEQRVADLQSLQWQIISFWQSKERLPQRLDELKSDITGFVPPTDPETKQSYEYSVLAPLRFRLCATFKTTSSADGAKPLIPRGYEEQLSNWNHDIGRVCFDRTVDPDFYPPIVKPARPQG